MNGRRLLTAVATIVALCLIGYGLIRVRALRDARGRTDLGLHAILTDPNAEITLHPFAKDAPPVRAIYALNGTWVFVVAQGPPGAYRVRLTGLDQRVTIDGLHGDANVVSAFETPKIPPVRIDLIRATDGTVAASAPFVYPRLRASP